MSRQADETMSVTPRITVGANVWVGDADDPMDGPVVVESEPCAVTVERTDSDEVALHVALPSDDNALVSVYVARSEVLAIAKLLELESQGQFGGAA